MNQTFPYPGLRPFERDETDIFFGREDHTDQLLEKLGQNRFLAVVGPSGCGKSSIVRTGLLAGLEGGLLASAGIYWHIAEMRPSNHPFARLAEALLDESALGEDYIKHFTDKPEAVASLQATLRRGPLSLDEVWQEAQFDTGTRLLLLVDQFEELFRYYQQGEVEETAAFVALLLAAYQNPNIYVIITMRSDFIGDCAAFYGLPEAVNAGLYLTPRLTRAQLSEAIALPATVFGGTVEEGLLNRLLNDAGNDPDQLPIVQHALMRMRQLAYFTGIEECVLTLAHYEQIGGFKKALSNHADKAYGELTAAQQKIAQVLFRNLSERDSNKRDTRRPSQLGEIARLAEVEWQAVVPVVEVFRKQGRHFLMPPVGQVLVPETVLDISHESLIRQWQRMQGWLNQEAESAKLYQRVEETALRWEKRQAALWRSPELEQATTWRTQAQPTAQWASRYGQHFALAMNFLEESEKAQHKKAKAIQKRRRVTFSSLVGGLTIAIILMIFSLFQMNEAEEQAQIALIEKLGAQSILATQLPSASNGSYEQAVLLAVQAFKEKNSAVSRGNLLRVLQAKKQQKVVLSGHYGYVLSVAFSPDGNILASGSQDNTIRLWDVSLRKPLGEPLIGHSGWVRSIAFSPDGKILASGSRDNTVRLWDVATRTPLGEPLTGHSKPVYSVAFSPDGLTLASGSGDNTIRLWDVSRRKRLGKPLNGHSNRVWNVAFSPDGKLLASGSSDKTIRLWDVLRRKPLSEPLTGHSDEVYSIAFSPDGLTLASGSSDNTVRLWDVQLRKPLGEPLTSHSKSVYSVAFSPDGLTLASGSSDNSVRLWDVNPESWLKQVCYIANRNFSQPEWRKYMGEQRPFEKTCPDSPQDTLGALQHIKQGEELAFDGKIEAAVMKFKQAQKLDARYLTVEPQTKAKHFFALGLVEQGGELAIKGEIEVAIAKYQEAQQMDSNLRIYAGDWNTLCWYASVYEHAAKAILSCEKAVALNPEDGNIRGSRALARALNGNIQGAIEDFQFAIENYDDDRWTQKMQGWLDALLKKKNPFTEEVLKGLR